MAVIDRSTAPAPAEPRPYRFPHVTRTTLSNGLRILIAENHNAPLVAMRALVRSGADHDRVDTAGLASLTADLLDEGAGDRDAIRLAEDIGLLGGALGAGADWDASYVTVDGLASTLAEATAIFADVTARATLPADGLERVRAERLNEILQQRNEPAAIAGKRFASILYGQGSYGNSIGGSAESVARITLDQVRGFYEQHYRPNNTSVVVSGDVTPETAVELVTRHLEAWQSGPIPEQPAVQPVAIESSRVFVIDRPQAVQSEIRLGHLGVPRSCEDYFPLALMNAILGGVFNSRINLNLRERHGYTYGARSQFAFRRQAGPFVVAAPVRNEVTREAVTEMLNELRRIRTGDIEAGELEDTRNYLMGVFPATVQTASDVAGRLLDMELFGLPESYFDEYRDRIASVTRDDIERVARKYVDPERVIIVIVGNAAVIRDPIGALGMPVHELDIDGNMLPVA